MKTFHGFKYEHRHGFYHVFLTHLLFCKIDDESFTIRFIDGMESITRSELVTLSLLVLKIENENLKNQ